MPELPEVETVVREFHTSHLIGKKIVRVEIFWPKTIHNWEPAKFCNYLVGQTICDISRKGKFIVFSFLNEDALLVHLRMTGKFYFAKSSSEILKHERVRIHLDDQRVLCYEDQRKFGRWFLLSTNKNCLDVLGLEPLSKQFTQDAFEILLKKRKSVIKAFLLNQKNIAGLGNIYVDEALWEAKIHPLRRADTLTKKEIKNLFVTIPKVLKKGIKNQGTTLGSSRANYFSVSGRRGQNQHQLNVFRRNDLPCPRCKETIIKIRVMQRGTHICPICQQL